MGAKIFMSKSGNCCHFRPVLDPTIHYYNKSIINSGMFQKDFSSFLFSVVF